MCDCTCERRARGHLSQDDCWGQGLGAAVVDGEFVLEVAAVKPAPCLTLNGCVFAGMPGGTVGFHSGALVVISTVGE